MAVSVAARPPISVDVYGKGATVSRITPSSLYFWKDRSRSLATEGSFGSAVRQGSLQAFSVQEARQESRLSQ